MFRSQIDYTGAGGVPSNTTYTGPWIRIENAESLGFIVTVPGASNPTAVWSLEVSNDSDAKDVTDANLKQAVTSIPLLATQATAANPAGAGVAIQALIQYERAGGVAVQYMPRAKFARLKMTVSGGGTTGTGVKISMSVWGSE
jgi:hypothetical protein